MNCEARTAWARAPAATVRKATTAMHTDTDRRIGHLPFKGSKAGRQ
jgi:hypothetical protein